MLYSKYQEYYRLLACNFKSHYIRNQKVEEEIGSPEEQSISTKLSALYSKGKGDDIILKSIFNRSEEEIRFLGIDAPELKRCRKLFQDERETLIPSKLLIQLGRLAFNFMKEIVLPEKRITIELEKMDSTDLYGEDLWLMYIYQKAVA